MSHRQSSPWVFFGLTAVFFAPFPILATVVHVPGLPKNAPVTDFVAAFCPAAAALVLTARHEGRAGVRRLLRRSVDRVGHPVWYLPVVALPVVVLGLTAALIALTGVRFQQQPALSPTTMLLFLGVFLLAAAGEELGWSGHAVGALRRRHGALGAAVLLGLVWWAFHVPSILQSGQDGTLIVLGLFGTVALRVLWTWLFVGTGGSVSAMILLHAMTNVCSAYVPSVPTSATAPVTVVLAVLVVALCGRSLHGRMPARLSRRGPRRAGSGTGPAGTGR